MFCLFSIGGNKSGIFYRLTGEFKPPESDTLWDDCAFMLGIFWVMTGIELKDSTTGTELTF